MTNIYVNVNTKKDAERLIGMQILSAEEEAVLIKKFNLPKPLGEFTFKVVDPTPWRPSNYYSIGFDEDLDDPAMIPEKLQEIYNSPSEFAQEMLLDTSHKYEVYFNAERIQWGEER